MECCRACGNAYDKTFEIKYKSQTYIFDCFECAIHMLAPPCKNCNCKIIGHGVESNNDFYCCASCAKQAGVLDLKDRN